MPVIIDPKSLAKMQKKRKAKKMPQMKDPVKPERDFRVELTALHKEILNPATERLAAMVSAGVSPLDISDAIESVLREAREKYTLSAQEIVARWKFGMDRDTRAALLRGLRDTTGIDMTAIYDDPAIRYVLSTAGMEAASLITDIPEEYAARIAQAVADSVIGNPLPEGRTLLEQIRKIEDMTFNRAKVIARDQTKKLTSSINQERQTSIGITTYIWKTSRDRRVAGNPSGLYPKTNEAHGNHWMMEGMLCRWNDPTVYSKDDGKTWIKRNDKMPDNHPGQDIQCRCHASPIIDVQAIIAHSRIA